MPSPKYFPIIVSAVLLACGSDAPAPPKPPDAFTVFPNLPLPPEAQFVSRAGSEDALQITMISPIPAAQVIDYYRNELSRGKWRLVGDSKRPDGSVLLYAEQDGPPIWVRIWPTTDKAGTMVELAGAVVGKDSAKVKETKGKSGTKPST
jgi:hypothetical protein